MNLPRGYLSYSAWKLWRTSKPAFRKRYYDNEEPFSTPETVFGKQIAEWLENNDDRVKHIPNYIGKEHDLKKVIDGVKILGRLDGFDPVLRRFLDHKTGHADKDGNPPWNRIKVHRHDQLPFYSWLIKEIYGSVNNVCHLVWIETKFITKTVSFDGHELSAKSRELVMTGRVKKYRRVIREFERKKIKVDVLLAAKEISEDYANYTRNKRTLPEVSENKAPEESTYQRTTTESTTS
jgi:hypothetical protein